MEGAFEQVFNSPEPEISVDRSEEASLPIEIEMKPITDDKFKTAIEKLLKKYKALLGLMAYQQKY